MHLFGKRIFFFYTPPARHTAFHPKHIAFIPLILNYSFLRPQIISIFFVAVVLSIPTYFLPFALLFRIIDYMLFGCCLINSRLLDFLLIISEAIRDKNAANGEIGLREVLLPLSVPTPILEIAFIDGGGRY